MLMEIQRGRRKETALPNVIVTLFLLQKRVVSHTAELGTFRDT